MIQQDTLRREVAELLQAQQSVLAELNALLEDEATVLREREPARVEELASSKLNIVQTLERQGGQLSSLLLRQGLQPGAEGVRQLMDGLSLSDHWQQCVSLLQKCQQHNAVNGGLIEASRGSNERILSLLQGQTLSPRLYGSTGKFDNGSGSGTLAEA